MLNFKQLETLIFIDLLQLLSSLNCFFVSELLQLRVFMFQILAAMTQMEMGDGKIELTASGDIEKNVPPVYNMQVLGVLF